MKLLLTLVVLFSAVLVAPAQDTRSSEVLIPLPVATFFLEQNDKVKILEAQVDTLRKDNQLLGSLDSIRVKQISIEQSKNKYYDSLVQLNKAETEACRKSEAGLSKNLKRQKFITKAVGAAGVVLIILALL